MVNDNSSSTSGYAKPDFDFPCSEGLHLPYTGCRNGINSEHEFEKGNKKSVKNLQLVFTTNGG